MRANAVRAPEDAAENAENENTAGMPYGMKLSEYKRV